MAEADDPQEKQFLVAVCTFGVKWQCTREQRGQSPDGGYLVTLEPDLKAREEIRGRAVLEEGSAGTKAVRWEPRSALWESLWGDQAPGGWN